MVSLPKIGVLAIQGDYQEHKNMLEDVGAVTKEIRLPNELEDIDGLIIPGGESTTIIQLIDIYEMRNPIIERVNSGMAIWGTCAGMISIAKTLKDKRPDPLHLMDIEVSRNAFGRQIDSFETYLDIKNIEGPPVRGIFIRAPVVTNIGKGVEILSEIESGKPVMVLQDKMLATSFHPELTDDTRIHEFFKNLSSAK
ncbi:MAG: pyridoxal 5'-phosphate synthase glutaminase subunit PdxT [Dehalococcoidia bacterium]|nr:pyridoxal 5'-phosphate synthase glutaminase subunit PdxT [Dehalococcoidia bacterium]